eukprot:80512_1
MKRYGFSEEHFEMMPILYDIWLYCIPEWITHYSISMRHLEMMPTLYHMWLYCNKSYSFNKRNMIWNAKHFQEEWSKYKNMLPAMIEKVDVVINDPIVNYHLCICALSHVLRNLDSFAPYQINCVIIANKLSTI